MIANELWSSNDNNGTIVSNGQSLIIWITYLGSEEISWFLADG